MSPIDAFHKSTIPKTTKKRDDTFSVSSLFVWSLLGSNQGPSDYESDALTN